MENLLSTNFNALFWYDEVCQKVSSKDWLNKTIHTKYLFSCKIELPFFLRWGTYLENENGIFEFGLWKIISVI